MEASVDTAAHRPNTPKMPETIVYRPPTADDRRPSTSGSQRRPAPPTTPRKVSSTRRGEPARTPPVLCARFVLHSSDAARRFEGCSRHRLPPRSHVRVSPDASVHVRHCSKDGCWRRCAQCRQPVRRTACITACQRIRRRPCARRANGNAAAAGSARRTLPTAFPSATPRFATLSDLLSHRSASQRLNEAHRSDAL
jgi:hypothetical protein